MKRTKKILAIVLSLALMLSLMLTTNGQNETTVEPTTNGQEETTEETTANGQEETTVEPTTNPAEDDDEEIQESNEEWWYSISGNNVTLLEYIGQDLDVVIPSEVEGKTVTGIGSSVFGYIDEGSSYSDIVTITIPESITKIEKDAFEACANLTNIIGKSGSYAETWTKENNYTFVTEQ